MLGGDRTFNLMMILTSSLLRHSYIHNKPQKIIFIEILLIIEMFYLNSTLNFGIPPVLVFQLEVYCKVGRLLTGLTA